MENQNRTELNIIGSTTDKNSNNQSESETHETRDAYKNRTGQSSYGRREYNGSSSNVYISKNTEKQYGQAGQSRYSRKEYADGYENDATDDSRKGNTGRQHIDAILSGYSRKAQNNGNYGNRITKVQYEEPERTGNSRRTDSGRYGYEEPEYISSGRRTGSDRYGYEKTGRTGSGRFAETGVHGYEEPEYTGSGRRTGSDRYGYEKTGRVGGGRLAETGGYGYEEPERAGNSRQTGRGRYGYEEPEYTGSGRHTGSDRYRKNTGRNDDVYGYAEDKDRKKSKRKKVVIIILSAVAAAIIAVILIIKLSPDLKGDMVKEVLKSDLGASIAENVVGDDYNKNVLDADFDKSKVVINGTVSMPDGYMTIALFGVDARDGTLNSAGTLSDSIMLLSVNTQTEDVKLASISRDTYLLDSYTSYDDYYCGKANAAYQLGGPLGAVNMLNRNWDMAITDYISVNFGGLTEIIDAVGGLTITITQGEVDEINYRMDEQIQSFGGEYIPVTAPGTVTLNGAQATAFARIREESFVSPEDGNTYYGDFGRTARQRYVLKLLLAKFKEQGVTKLIDIANDICANNTGTNKFISTSLSLDNLMELLSNVMDMNISAAEVYPTADHLDGAMLDCGDSIIADTLPENVQILHNSLYGQANYNCSDDFYGYNSIIEYEIQIQTNNASDTDTGYTEDEPDNADVADEGQDEEAYYDDEAENNDENPDV